MSYYRWNLTVLSVVAVVVFATVTINYRINFYGLFGDVKGEKYIVYDNDRTTKYLLSHNYIPQNFDGLLIGSSASENWDTGDLAGIRMYNASIAGGNISEEALIANNVLRQVQPRIVVFLIHPYLTETYGRKSGFMNPQEYWGALGSLQLLRGYWSKWSVEHGYARRESNEFGTDDFLVPPHLPVQQPQGAQVGTDFFIEPRAIQEYRDLLERVRSKNARVAAIIPPVQMGYWQTIRAEFDDYCSKLTPLFHDGEPILDLNSPEMNNFRDNPNNYQDEVHLSSQGAKNIMQVIGNWLTQKELIGMPTSATSSFPRTP